MDDAFAIRGKVIVVMCILAGVGFVCMVLVGLKIWGMGKWLRA